MRIRCRKANSQPAPRPPGFVVVASAKRGTSKIPPPGILTNVLCIHASEEEAHERDPYLGLGPRALVVAGRACRGGPGLPPHSRPCAGGSRALRTRGADAGGPARAPPRDPAAAPPPRPCPRARPPPPPPGRPPPPGPARAPTPPARG